MKYAIFCYHDESEVMAWSKAEVETVLAKRGAVSDRWAASGRLKVSAALMPTSAALTVRHGKEPLVLDGPFAELKEQLLGFYVVDCDNLEDVVAFASEMLKGESGAFEIRPIHFLDLPAAR